MGFCLFGKKECLSSLKEGLDLFISSDEEIFCIFAEDRYFWGRTLLLPRLT